MKRLTVLVSCLCLLLTATACNPREEETTLLLAAAASLEQVFERELIPLFESTHPGILVRGTYDSSGRLQIQIEQGLHADLYMAAAMAPMDALIGQNLMKADTVVTLLENTLVLIRPVGVDTAVTGFADVLYADFIAIGDPGSVPAGMYARQVFTYLGIWQEVEARASLAMNVTEVLAWVATASAEVGVVYATDAALSEQVVILAEAPSGSLSTLVLYPVGVVAGTEHEVAAMVFLQFLQSPEALAIFESFGFSPH